MTETRKGKKGNVMKVVELGLDKRVYEAMKQQDFSVESLAREFKDEGVKITAQSIRKFIKNTKKAQRELISKDLQTAEVYKKTIMDYASVLKKILEEVEEVKNETKTEKDYASYNAMVGRLMQGVELIAKLSGDLRPTGSVDINIIYQEINNNIESDMKNIKEDLFKNNVIDIDSQVIKEDKLQQEKINS